MGVLWNNQKLESFKVDEQKVGVSVSIFSMIELRYCLLNLWMYQGIVIYFVRFTSIASNLCRDLSNNRELTCSLPRNIGQLSKLTRLWETFLEEKLNHQTLCDVLIEYSIRPNLSATFWSKYYFIKYNLYRLIKTIK